MDCEFIYKYCSFLLTSPASVFIIEKNREDNPMRPIDVGCLEKSTVFFYTAGEIAKQTFFYPLCVGHYYCTDQYLVQRNNYNSFLLIYVKRGEGFLEVNQKNMPFTQKTSFSWIATNRIFMERQKTVKFCGFISTAPAAENMST